MFSDSLHLTSAIEPGETSRRGCAMFSDSPHLNSGSDSGQASTSGTSRSKISSSLKGFLYTIADSPAVHRVLNCHGELIDEHEIETKPEEICHINYDQYVLDAAKPLFTTDGWLSVKSILTHAKAFDKPTCSLQNKEGSAAFSSEMALNEGITLESNNTSTQNKDGVKNDNVSERQYIRWSREDTRKVNEYFSKYVYDVSRFDNKGVLPGYTEMRRFLKTYPDLLAHLPIDQKLKPSTLNYITKGINPDE